MRQDERVEKTPGVLFQRLTSSVMISPTPNAMVRTICALIAGKVGAMNLLTRRFQRIHSGMRMRANCLTSALAGPDMPRLQTMPKTTPAMNQKALYRRMNCLRESGAVPRSVDGREAGAVPGSAGGCLLGGGSKPRIVAINSFQVFGGKKRRDCPERAVSTPERLRN